MKFTLRFCFYALLSVFASVTLLLYKASTCHSSNLESLALRNQGGEHRLLRSFPSSEYTLPINLPTHSYINQDDLHTAEITPQGNNLLKTPTNATNCRMDNCFDFSKCQQGFKVYVYPSQERISDSYRSILNIIKSSRYYTTDPKHACIFISGVDTLDQDVISNKYVRNLQQHLHNLPYWNNGLNHLIFNLYSGTWPDYSEHMGLDLGFAMLAKASVSSQNFRTGFDISLPLFHNNLPEYAGEHGALASINIPSSAKRKYLLAFKGKRYLTGIGSVSRNRLYHLHNGDDILMLTTCKHGKDWEKYADKRCSADEDLYNKYDYNQLLVDSTFCLVPRGRRIGSYRFLEVLQYGCIPVLLSDNWELPFSEVIDWKSVALWADEDLLLQMPYMLRSLPYTRIMNRQQQSQHLWAQYFNSIQKIVLTTLQIVNMRVEPHHTVSSVKWNTHPGSRSLSPLFSADPAAFPFFIRPANDVQYTVLFYVKEKSVHLVKCLKKIAAAEYVHSVFVFVLGQPQSDLYSYLLPISQSISTVPIHVHPVNTLVESFKMYSEFPTDAVLLVNQRNSIITHELDFAFSVWKEYPERIVGHLARSHLWHDGEKRYHYSSKLSNQYSIVLLDTAVIHKYYLFKLLDYRQQWNDTIESSEQCYDILLNIIVSDISQLPPIKVGQRLTYSDSAKHTNQQLAVKSNCINIYYSKFGTVPLKYSHVRLDPALFKDNVAKSRKKYVDLEHV